MIRRWIIFWSKMGHFWGLWRCAPQDQLKLQHNCPVAMLETARFGSSNVRVTALLKKPKASSHGVQRAAFGWGVVLFVKSFCQCLGFLIHKNCWRYPWHWSWWPWGEDRVLLSQRRWSEARCRGSHFRMAEGKTSRGPAEDASDAWLWRTALLQPLR